MIYLGIEEFPEAVRRAILDDPYSRGDADISVTQLIDAPQVRYLREKHQDELVLDARRAIAPLIGRAVHSLLEVHSQRGQAREPEQRLYTMQCDWKISGQMDLQELSIVQVGCGPEGLGERQATEVIISDYKVVTARSLGYDKPGFEAQLNCYAELARRAGKVPVALRVIQLIKDWSEARASRDDAYPQSPVVVQELRLWPPKEAEEYLRERVRLHKIIPPPPCTAEERWYTSRRGSIRCQQDWCGVRAFCKQGQEEILKDAQSGKTTAGSRPGAIFPAPEVKRPAAAEPRAETGQLYSEGEAAGYELLNRES